MELSGILRVLQKIIKHLRSRNTKQIRDVLPVEVTTSWLRYIKSRACYVQAKGKIDCAKWTTIYSMCVIAPDPIYAMRTGESFEKVDGYVCDKCRHPYLPTNMLISKLGLDSNKPNFNERTFRRYINSKDPMPVDQFRRSVANAYYNKLISLYGLINEWNNIDKFVLVKKATIITAGELRNRGIKITKDNYDEIIEEFLSELQKQFQLSEYDQKILLSNILSDIDKEQK